MKQFYLKTLLLCLFMLAGLTVHAYDAKVNGIYYNFNETEKTAEVTYYSFFYQNETAYSGAVVIPSTVTYGGTTYSVTSIGNIAFRYCSGLTSITIPSSVTYIGENAFSKCSGLTSITIPNSVTSIGDDAFYKCSGLKKVIVPDIAAWCKISFSDFDSNPLHYAGHLYSDENTEITALEISNSVTSIGSYAFYDCSGLTSITIPNSVTSIGSYAFFGCRSLTSITIPNSVASIGKQAFSYCNGLTSITIPNSVTSIGSSAFYGCSGLTSITIPNSVTSISSYAFSNCSGLTSITIPNSVTTIYGSAFEGCSGLKKVIVPDIAAWCKISFSDFDSNPLYYAGHLYSDENTEITALEISNSVTSIGNYAFSWCSGLTSITIPNSVTEIGSDAFKGCSNLSTLTLNCKSIGSWFSGIKSLKTLTLNDSVTTIGYSAFSNCSGLTSITIPNSVTSIDWSAFYGCSGLTSITIPNSVTSIGSGAFSGCDKAKIFTNRGTTSLLALWYIDVEPYETGTDKLLTKPSLKQISSTQTTMTVKLENYYEEYEYTIDGKVINKNQPTVITGLEPGEYYYMYTSLGDLGYVNGDVKFYTKSISPSIQSNQFTASSAILKGFCSTGDAHVVAQYFTVGKDKIEGNTVTLTGLDPSTSYTAKYVVEIKYGDKEQYTTTYSSNEQTIKTSTLTLTTLQPKVATPGNVIVAAESNLDDAETNVGFEWRRTDWTDDFSSNTGGAFLYEGNMEGYIRNLNTEKLWKYRPYYESKSGKRYYGEWMGLDPTNTSFFEPTVHTYANVSVQGNQAEVKGYAMRGSDNVTMQGFKYWQQPAGARALAGSNVSVPKNAMTAEANGNIMTTTLEGLDYLTTYCYVAFMTTSEGDTFYGELRTFETGEDTSGIEDIPSATKTAAGTQKVYDLNGRRIAQPRRGLNIIRTADGRTVKVMKK